MQVICTGMAQFFRNACLFYFYTGTGNTFCTGFSIGMSRLIRFA